MSKLDHLRSTSLLDCFVNVVCIPHKRSSTKGLKVLHENAFGTLLSINVFLQAFVGGDGCIFRGRFISAQPMADHTAVVEDIAPGLLSRRSRIPNWLLL
jgi:hypothetical protein